MSQNGTIVQQVERQFGSIIQHRVIADEPPKTRTERLACSSHVLDRAELAGLNRRGRMESQIIVSGHPHSGIPEPDHDSMRQSGLWLVEP
jgi:hypothetical protein